LPAMEQVAGRKAVACTGFNAHELADRALYDAKMTEFVKALDRRQTPGVTFGTALHV
jgi:hypothetical protein